MIDMITRNVGVRPGNYFSIRGFTIVETMVTIALISIITALALPSYSVMVEKRKLTSSAQQLAAFINQGHTEAARRNEPVTISYRHASHTSWCVGATLGNVACDCAETTSTEFDYCAIEGVEQVLNNADFGNTELVHLIDGNNSFSYDPIRGFLLDPEDTMLMELHTDSRDFRINLVVNESGNVKLCSKDNLHAVPGYPVC
jgi:type IV fimbrial biogenesis protein FimT